MTNYHIGRGVTANIAASHDQRECRGSSGFDSPRPNFLCFSSEGFFGTGASRGFERLPAGTGLGLGEKCKWIP